jgi:hypothetical protein
MRQSRKEPAMMIKIPTGASRFAGFVGVLTA